DLGVNRLPAGTVTVFVFGPLACLCFIYLVRSSSCYLANSIISCPSKHPPAPSSPDTSDNLKLLLPFQSPWESPIASSPHRPSPISGSRCPDPSKTEPTNHDHQSRI
ncbi:hypothetical protein FGSG_12502, partial [Fusarium graminearum PH-1]|uniref:hypothetical protein n=1 Tax=Gibberella zeae (strain ATCC MYA-4620 / CBS 123657 / FGSC 9075 / NRRL 31084 / PH-1) TaxID=229533 RepID=UPI0003C9F2F6